MSIEAEIKELRARLGSDYADGLDEVLAIVAPKPVGTKPTPKPGLKQVATMVKGALRILDVKSGEWVNVKRDPESARKVLKTYSKDLTIALRVQLKDLIGLEPGKPNPFWPEWKPSKASDLKKVVDRGYAPVPPLSWNLWVNPDPNGHPVAKWRSLNGKEQQRDHVDQEEERADKKFSTLKAMMASIEKIRKKYQAALLRRDFSEERILSGVIFLMDVTGMRPGSERHLVKGTVGANTLSIGHVKVSGDTVTLKFTGKAAKEHSKKVKDKQFAILTSDLLEKPPRDDLPSPLNDRLFIFEAKQGLWKLMQDRRVNEWMKAQGFAGTGKDFRTFRGNKMFMEAIAKHKRPSTYAGAEKVVKAVLQEVADLLGNTPAVTRKSYINPALIDAYLADFSMEPEGDGSKPKVKPKKIAGVVTAESNAEDDAYFLRQLEHIEKQYKDVGIDPDAELDHLEGDDG